MLSKDWPLSLMSQITQRQGIKPQKNRYNFIPLQGKGDSQEPSVFKL